MNKIARNCTGTNTQVIDNNSDDLLITEYSKRKGHSKKLFWSIKFKNGKQELNCEKPDTEEIQNKIINISPMILSDINFKGSEISFKEGKFKLKTDTGKEVFITDNSGNIESPLKIIKKLSYQNMDTSDISPISLDTVEELINNGIEIYKISGENNPYKLEDLELLLLTTGISPVTRKSFSKKDIVKWINEDSTDLPIGIFNPTKRRKVLFKSDSKIEETIEDSNSKNSECNPINLICLIDKSYSMRIGCSDYDNVATKPFLDYLDSLHSDSEITIFAFSDSTDEVIKKEKNSEINRKLIVEKLVPDGSTYFNGSIVKIINEWDNYYNKDMKNLFLIITDGEDTKSSNEEKNMMNELIRDCWDNIPCYFMHPPNINGSNLLNLNEGQCLAFDNDQDHTIAAVSGLSQLTRTLSSSQDNHVPVITNDLRRQSSQSCSNTYETYEEEEINSNEELNNGLPKINRYASAPI